jgi:tetratricopeptide (TPR) repeat protein
MNGACIFLTIIRVAIIAAIAAAGPRAGEISNEQPAPQQRQFSKTSQRAFGYASVYNVPEVERIVAEKLRSAGDGSWEREQLVWARAVAYVKFMLEYRNLRHWKEFQRDLQELRALKSSLLALSIPDPYIKLQVMLNGKTLSSMLEDADQQPIPEVRAMWTGYVYQNMALSSEGTLLKFAQRDLLEKALQQFQTAAGLLPDYECHLYVADTLCRLDRCPEAVDSIQRLIKLYENDTAQCTVEDSPALKLIVYRQRAKLESNPRKGIEELISKYPDDESLLYMRALMVLDEGSTETTIAHMRNLEAKLHSSLKPWRLRILASLYYKFAAVETSAEHYSDALKTYEKLAAISPHYVQAHYYKAETYLKLAKSTESTADRRRLLKTAQMEVELQKQYNWQNKNDKILPPLESLISSGMSPVPR